MDRATGQHQYNTVLVIGAILEAPIQANKFVMDTAPKHRPTGLLSNLTNGTNINTPMEEV
jgi:hypothetical protein